MSIGRESENRGCSFERGKFYLERRIILRFFFFLEGKNDLENEIYVQGYVLERVI